VTVVEIAIVVVVIGTLFGIRMYAARQVAKRRAGFAWLLQPLGYIVPVMLGYAAIRTAESSLPLGILLGLFALGYLAATLGFARLVARVVGTTPADKDITGPLFDALADRQLAFAAISLGGMIVLGIALVIWAIAQR
jgi:hypothetical protein